MGFYNDVLLPHLMDRAMANPKFRGVRSRVLQAAEGVVLEVGVGGGRNLDFYSERVDTLFGLDPDARALGLLRRRATGRPFAVHDLAGTAEAIPLDTGSVDCVVTTLTLCSLPDHDRALAEIRRVRRPGGAWLFAEHGRAPDRGVARWQDRLTPCTRALGGGCHLNYPIDRVIGGRGFGFDALTTGYVGRPKAAMYVYEGRARPA